MLKKLIIFLILFTGIPVFAGDVENALRQNQNVFLYFYSPGCSYCIRFMPIYNRLVGKYSNNYKFFKYDNSSEYAYRLFRNYNGRYVPYVVLVNNKKISNIRPECLLNQACIEYEMKAFIK